LAFLHELSCSFLISGLLSYGQFFPCCAAIQNPKKQK
jgi:hypothetical protein